MKKLTATKKHILVKRFKLIKFLKSEGYNNEEIGLMFNMDRLQIFRVLQAGERYKVSIKNLLKD